jgi:hypothetical protein
MRYKIITSIKSARGLEEILFTTISAAEAFFIDWLKQHDIPYEINSSEQIVSPGSSVGDPTLCIVDRSFCPGKEQLVNRVIDDLKGRPRYFRQLGLDSLAAQTESLLEDLGFMADLLHAEDERPALS